MGGNAEDTWASHNWELGSIAFPWLSDMSLEGKVSLSTF